MEQFKVNPDDVSAIMHACDSRVGAMSVYDGEMLSVPPEHVKQVRAAMSDLAGSRKIQLTQLAHRLARHRIGDMFTVDDILALADAAGVKGGGFDLARKSRDALKKVLSEIEAGKIKSTDEVERRF
jgi:hypothetical protein